MKSSLPTLMSPSRNRRLAWRASVARKFLILDRPELKPRSISLTFSSGAMLLLSLTAAMSVEPSSATIIS